MPALAGVFVTFASTASTAHRTHVMDCYASHSVQVLILPLRRTPVGETETASNELAMSLAGIGESSKAFMISNRAERIERALVGDKAFRRSLIYHTLLVRAHHIVLCAYKSPCLGRSTRDGRIANGRARASNVAWLGSRRAIHLGWAHGTPRDDQCQRESPKTRSDISDINE